MQFSSKLFQLILVASLSVSLLSAWPFKKKKYENPITKDTLQPDKVLFDRAIKDIEHGKYEVARLTLNTLINTYDTSEYLAKAKLAIADSWYREGGSHGLAQAEAEYKDFILFYPAMEESAESQWKVCQIHYKQMEKSDRDSSQAIRAEDECRLLVTQFPNSKYLPQAQQMLRDTQEVLGAKEFGAGAFYHSKGAYPAAASRLTFVADQYPLFSGVDEALWQAADSFRKMGDRFETQAATGYARIVKDYPLSDHADEAKDRLTELKRPVPAADPAAVARMQYDLDNRTKPGMMHKALGLVSRGPDTHTAAKSGAPAMAALRPPTPVSVPAVAAAPAAGTGSVTSGTGGTGSDVTVNLTSGSAIDEKPEARQNTANSTGTPAAGVTISSGTSAVPAVSPTGTPAASSVTAAPPPVQEQPLPTNRVAEKPRKKSKKQLKAEQDALKKQQAAAAATPPSAPKQ